MLTALLHTITWTWVEFFFWLLCHRFLQLGQDFALFRKLFYSLHIGYGEKVWIIKLLWSISQNCSQTYYLREYLILKYHYNQSMAHCLLCELDKYSAWSLLTHYIHRDNVTSLHVSCLSLYHKLLQMASTWSSLYHYSVSCWCLG